MSKSSTPTRIKTWMTWLGYREGQSSGRWEKVANHEWYKESKYPKKIETEEGEEKTNFKENVIRMAKMMADETKKQNF